MTEKQIRDAIAELTRAGANVNVDVMYASILGQIARSKLPVDDREALQAELDRKRNELLRRQPPPSLADMTPEQRAMAEQLMGNRPQNEQAAQDNLTSQTGEGGLPLTQSMLLEAIDPDFFKDRPLTQSMLLEAIDPDFFKDRPLTQSMLLESIDPDFFKDRPLTQSMLLEAIDPDFFKDSNTTTTNTSGDNTSGGSTTAADAATRDADQAEVERLLAEQFGGFAFFLQKHRSDLQVGLTADGQVVAADDPNAMTVKNVLDVIVDQGITAPTRVRGLLEQTDWFKNTDARMREYDVLTADMSEPEKTEYLEPVLDLLREEAQFLGIQLDPTIARKLAEDIKKMGEENDSEYVRGALIAESEFNAAESVASGFATQRDRIVALSKQYFTPIDEAAAATYAEDIYIGTKTEADFEQMFREQAAATYPPLENALNAGITPEQYFAPYKYEIERMLDRPNVDLYEEFGDVIQFIPDTGTDQARPMTLGEVRKYVRGLDEWQQSSSGKESARALSFSIGKLFGEVA